MTSSRVSAARLSLTPALFGLALALSCTGTQSALEPAGEQASELAALFWWMTGGVAVIWIAVLALALYASYTPERSDLTSARRLIVWGGAVFPTIVLTGLACYGLALLPKYLAPAPREALRVAVTGEQYWWRVRYLPRGGAPVELANEIRLPVGEDVEFVLESRDVIHSFWIPSLAGKMDMIPGKQTRLRLRPTRTGQFRGVCAEYCGASHAWMAFSVVVQPKAEFERWLAAQARPARTPEDPVALLGRDTLLANGCGACHAVRGTRADGAVGPDLTHVGGRASLGAGLLSNDPAQFHRWVSDTSRLKPGVQMPAYGMLAPPELSALAAYLESLE